MGVELNAVGRTCPECVTRDEMGWLETELHYDTYGTVVTRRCSNCGSIFTVDGSNFDP